MDLSRRAVQTNVKLFFKFHFRFRIIGRNPKHSETNREA